MSTEQTQAVKGLTRQKIMRAIAVETSKGETSKQDDVICA